MILIILVFLLASLIILSSFCVNSQPEQKNNDQLLSIPLHHALAFLHAVELGLLPDQHKKCGNDDDADAERHGQDGGGCFAAIIRYWLGWHRRQWFSRHGR